MIRTRRSKVILVLDGAASVKNQFAFNLAGQAQLSPPVLLEHGLLAGLTWLGEQMRRHHIAVAVECTLEELRLPEEQALLLFQSVRELLLNAAKHAGSSHATVSANHRNGMLHIAVADQGKGFDPSHVANSPSSAHLFSKFGLFSIRERMRALGGRFEIVSAVGKGTTGVLELPVTVQALPHTPDSVLATEDLATLPLLQAVFDYSLSCSIMCGRLWCVCSWWTITP